MPAEPFASAYQADGNQLISTSPVLVTQQSEQVWVARLLTWAGFAVEGNSREDALQKLDQQVKAQLADGEIAYLNLPLAQPLTQAENPWLAIAGKYADDPTWNEYQAAITAARREANLAET
jgi:predicted RNase H-like HicB family nuclease